MSGLLIAFIIAIGVPAVIAGISATLSGAREGNP